MTSAMTAALELIMLPDREFNHRFEGYTATLLHNFDLMWRRWRDYRGDPIHGRLIEITSGVSP